jgi:hypothetical protein
MKRALLIAVVLSCGHPIDPWAEYRSEPGRFRVELPGVPKLGTHQTVTLPAPTTSYQALLERGERGSFQVSYYDLSMDLESAAESGAKLDCLSAAGDVWTIADQHPQKLGAAPGYAITVTAPISDHLPNGGYGQDRCFVVGQRMYHLTAVGPNTIDQKRDTEHFLESFHTF